MNTPIRMQLMPGVWLTAIQTRKFKSSFWSLQLLTPLEKKTASMAAVLPRVLRRGTAACPDQEQLGAALDDLYGGVIEPAVSKLGEVQMTGFMATFLDDSLTLDGRPIYPRAAELMGDLLLRPATKNGRLRSDYVLSERQNLLSDIKSLFNDKRTYSAVRLTQEMCRKEAYGVHRLGTQDEAEKITVTRLDKYYRQLLRESRVELYYCGSAKPEQIRQAWVEALMGLPRGQERELPETVTRIQPEEVRLVCDQMTVTQAKLAMGFRAGTCIQDGDYPALLMMNAVFGGGPNSKLFLNVREKLSLCYYAASGVDKHKSLILVQSGIDLDKTEETQQEILRQLQAVRDGEFTDEDLEGARRLMLNQLTSCQDSQGALAAFYQDYVLSEHMLSPEELARQVREVKREDVISSAQKVVLDTVYLLTASLAEAKQEN
ncbi:MAG: insulinase family protein [Oscillospiraceae bacterium]|nr:insulinase family protein [Oscillospiraceae bacterium]